MRIIVLGPPGAGKGTQTVFLQDSLHIPQISTGDMLRAAVREGSALGKELAQIMQAGELVQDDLIIALLAERIACDDCQNGFLLDGFPRTIAQADGLQLKQIYIDYVLELKVDDEAVIQRMSGRRVHPTSGRSYHIEFNPPRQADIDDLTGEPLVQREDDSEETVRKRLTVYYAQTYPLRKYYTALTGEHAPLYIEIDATASVSKVKANILAALHI